MSILWYFNLKIYIFPATQQKKIKKKRLRIRSRFFTSPFQGEIVFSDSVDYLTTITFFTAMPLEAWMRTR